MTDENVENLFHEADVREEVGGQVSVYHACVPMIIVVVVVVVDVVVFVDVVVVVGCCCCCCCCCCLLVVVVVMLFVREYSSVRMSA